MTPLDAVKPRQQALEVPLLLFFLFSAAGWAWEVALGLVTAGQAVNRGFLRGPWLPVYGVGGVLLLGLLRGLRGRPWALLPASALVGGAVEYSAALLLEGLFRRRWWDYSGWAGNLQGRVCLASMAAFALAGWLVVEWAGPALARRLAELPPGVRRICCRGVSLLFALDWAAALLLPHTGPGITFPL